MTSEDAADEDKQKTPLALPTQPYCRIHCRQSAVRAARFNADGNYCMTAGGDKTIKLWNPYNCRLLKTYTGHGGEVSDVQVSVKSLFIYVYMYVLNGWRQSVGSLGPKFFAPSSDTTDHPPVGREVRKELQVLKGDKAPGSDNLTPSLF
ncbi:unnamed protein product [Trichobilharzia regenti]|nr:unnamed protein product [Trichobilharzia regenti]